MRIQIFLLLAFSLSLFSCPPQGNENPNSTEGTSITTVTTDVTTPKILPPFEMEYPRDHTLVKQASGDLDKDKIDEKVIVLNTGQSGEFGKERVLLIFKIQDGAWKLWHRSTGAILPSEHGGMMGDPFQSIAIENGAIVINHFGGSSSKWAYTHRFRYQNEAWELIGATTVSEYFTELETFDYNLSSGKVMYRKDEIDYDNNDQQVVKATQSKATFISKMNELPTLDGFDVAKVFAVDSKTGLCYPPNACSDRKTGLDEIEFDKGRTVIK